MKITGNEPAMPIVNSDGFCSLLEHVEILKESAVGLTIRQQFAMAAMQGMCADTNTENMSVEVLANIAVSYADALINELNKADHANG